MSDQQVAPVHPDDVMKALAVRGLRGAQVSVAELAPIDRLDPRSLVGLAETTRMLGPMLGAVHDGELDFDDDSTRFLVERHEANMLWAIKLEARMLEVRDLFAAAGGVRHLILKGSAIAHLDEDDPAMRSTSDVDVLVAGDDLDRAVGALSADGATRQFPQRRPGWDRRFAKSVTMTGTDAIEIDLHRMLCDGVFGVRLPLAELFAESNTFELGGEPVGALSRPHRFLHAAWHAVLGSRHPKLLNLRDLARYMDSPALAPDAIAPIARHWGGEAVLVTAIREVHDALPFQSPTWTDWAHQTTPTIPQREFELVERHRNEGSSFGRAKVDMWRELPSLRLKSAYAWGAVVGRLRRSSDAPAGSE